MTRAAAFLDGPPSGYGSRLARLRWARAAAAERFEEWESSTRVARALAAAGEWVVVWDSSALPCRPLPALPARGILEGRPVEPRTVVHTLRELESVSPEESGSGAEPAAAPAIAWVFRSAELGARDGETAAELVRRLRETDGEKRAAFPVVAFDEPSSRERPELTRRLPGRELRILDLGCGAGAAIAGARGKNPGWSVTGIERDSRLAARARTACDEVIEGDLRELLPRLAEDGRRFDAVVFGDVLEHLEEPVEALRAVRRLASRGATLVASVPNAGHLSVVRDLLHGRFDPVPAGLCDVGHLRWFTRSSLRDAIQEAGWEDVRIEAEPGSAPADPEPLLALAREWPEGDPESLLAYQWIATARNV